MDAVWQKSGEVSRQRSESTDSDDQPWEEFVSNIFANTPSNSPIRLFTVDLSMMACQRKHGLPPMSALETELPGLKEFYHMMCDLALQLRGRSVTLPWQQDRCYYHDQPDAFSCTDPSRPNLKANVRKY